MTEGSRAGDLRDALQSAVQRLPLAVITVDGSGTVRMMNRAGAELFEREGIGKDIFTSRPSHPLSALLRDVFAEGSIAPRVLTFASGARYEVEPSRKSEKGGDRLVMLLIRKLENSDVENPALFSRWDFTPRESDVARALMAGKSSQEMRESLGISTATLKTHLKQLLRKTDTHTRAELVALLLRR